MRWVLPVALLAALSACASTSSQVQTSFATSGGSGSSESSSSSTDIVVTTAKSLDRSCEILEVFDIHTHADSEDKGFDELRARAKAIGADAVIGAEFEHGDGNEPSHLSGMAVKYTQPTPPYDVLGNIDIPSDEDASDKGLDAMKEQARAMGADEIIDVHFEHGEEGKLGHLTGVAVKYRR